MNIKRFTGIIKLSCFEDKTQKNFYVGGITLYINRLCVLCTAFIPNIINAEYISRYDIENREIYDFGPTTEINGTRLNVYKQSEMWDYTIFRFDKNFKNKTIHFPKINTIKVDYSVNSENKQFKKLELHTLGNVEIKLDYYKMVKKSDKIFYTTHDIDTYLGTLIFIQDNDTFKIFGITGNLYTDNNLLIIPLINFYQVQNERTFGPSLRSSPLLIDFQEKSLIKGKVQNERTFGKVQNERTFGQDDIKIDLKYENYYFHKSIYNENEYINNKKYPCLNEKYRNLEKNDIIIAINNEPISELMIYNNEFDIYQPINQYLEYNINNKNINVTIYRSKEIINIY